MGVHLGQVGLASLREGAKELLSGPAQNRLSLPRYLRRAPCPRLAPERDCATPEHRLQGFVVVRRQEVFVVQEVFIVQEGLFRHDAIEAILIEPVVIVVAVNVDFRNILIVAAINLGGMLVVAAINHGVALVRPTDA